jgi:phosphoglycolate phosphatase
VSELSRRVILLWDIDGTLLTTGRAGIFALEQAAREVCRTTIELDDMHTAGLTDAQIAARIISACGETPDQSAVLRFLDVYGAALPEHLPRREGRVLAGVEAILAELRGEPRALSLLLTGNVEPGARAKLAYYGLDGYLREGAFCTGLGDRAQIAREAVALAGRIARKPVDLDRTYVIGDTPADVLCGRAVGARTIAVASGAHTVEELAGYDPWSALPRLPGPDEFRLLVDLPQRAPG